MEKTMLEYYLRVTEATKGSDRVSAIVLGAAVQDSLKDAVCSKLVKRSEHAAKLLSPDGPLGNWGVLNDLAHSVGLISDIVWHDLDCVRRIRNAFAHWGTRVDSTGEPKSVTFATDKNRHLSSNLKCPEILPPCDFGPDIATFVWPADGVVARLPPPVDARERFELTCLSLLHLCARMEAWHLFEPDKDMGPFDYTSLDMPGPKPRHTDTD